MSFGKIRTKLPDGEKACPHGKQRNKCQKCVPYTFCYHGKLNTLCISVSIQGIQFSMIAKRIGNTFLTFVSLFPVGTGFFPIR